MALCLANRTGTAKMALFPCCHTQTWPGECSWGAVSALPICWALFSPPPSRASAVAQTVPLRACLVQRARCDEGLLLGDPSFHSSATLLGSLGTCLVKVAKGTYRFWHVSSGFEVADPSAEVALLIAACWMLPNSFFPSVRTMQETKSSRRRYERLV